MIIGNFNTKQKPFIIAEIGGNHEGRFDYAKKLLLDAASTGCNVIKFQIYKGDTIVSEVENGARHKHFKKFELGDDAYKELAKMAENNNMLFCASFWSKEEVDVFDSFVKFYKIGGGDFTNYPIIEYIAKKNKPMLLSTAMCNLDEVKQTIAFIDKINPELRKNNKICLLHCVAMYGEPKDEYANLLSIKVLQKEFPDIEIGYSDHTKGIDACKVAIAMGCKVIELHFTDNKEQQFRDHHLSADIPEMKELVEKSKTIEKSENLAKASGVDEEKVKILLGKQEKKPVATIETPERIQQFRRACYLKEDVKAGTVITEENLTTLRPNIGIDARKYFDILGKKLKKDKKAFERISEGDLE